MPTGIDYLDETWNPITGCSPVSEGCKHCWAKDQAERMKRMGCKKYQHDDPFAVRFHPDELDKPLHWKKPRRVGVCFMGDLFHKDVSDWAIIKIYRAMRGADWHTYLTLTKRPRRMFEILNWAQERGLYAWPLPNVYNGITAENQDRLDERAPELLKIPGKHWLSLEPLLGPMELVDGPPGAKRLFLQRVACFDMSPPTATSSPFGDAKYTGQSGACDWVVVGCESGANRRPCKLQWILDIVDQCKAAGVKCFVKQVPVPIRGRPLYLHNLDECGSEWLAIEETDKDMRLHGWRVSHDPSEWPECLRVRQLYGDIQ